MGCLSTQVSEEAFLVGTTEAAAIAGAAKSVAKKIFLEILTVLYVLVLESTFRSVSPGMWDN